MKQAIAFLLIMFSMVLFPLSASAATFRCSLKSMNQNFESADLVFSGVVVKQTDDKANGVDSEFKVSALWKGANSQYVNVIINKPNGMRLSDDFQQGEAYLIFAHKQEGKFY